MNRKPVVGPPLVLVTERAARLPEWAQIRVGQRCLCKGEGATGCTHGFPVSEIYEHGGCPYDATDIADSLPMCIVCARHHWNQR